MSIGILFPAQGEFDIDGRAVDRSANIPAASTLATFKIKDGREFGVYLDEAGQPVVESKQTGRVVAFSWSDIVALALGRGIDDKEPIVNPLQLLGEDYVHRREDSSPNRDCGS